MFKNCHELECVDDCGSSKSRELGKESRPRRPTEKNGREFLRAKFNFTNQKGNLQIISIFHVFD